MQSLLRWSIENSATQVGAPSNGSSPSERQNLDPGIIDAILGKPDSDQMKEDLAIAVDTTRSEDERVEALDHLEMVSRIHEKLSHKLMTLCIARRTYR
jgi:hsp70-interacting protein